MESSYKFPKSAGKNSWYIDSTHKLSKLNNEKDTKDAISLRIKEILGKKKNKKILNLNFSEFPDLFPENLYGDKTIEILNINNINISELINQRRLSTNNFNVNDVDSLIKILSGFIVEAIEQSPTFKFKKISQVVIKKYLEIFMKVMPDFILKFVGRGKVPKKSDLAFVEILGIFDIIFIQTPLGIDDRLFIIIMHHIIGAYLSEGGHGMTINTWKTFSTNFYEDDNVQKKESLKNLAEKPYYKFRKGVLDSLMPFYRYRENILGQTYSPHTGVETSLFEFKKQIKTIDQIISCDFRTILKKQISYEQARIVKTDMREFRSAKISIIQNELIENANKKSLKYYNLGDCAEIFQINLRNQNKNKSEVIKKIKKLKNTVFIPTIPSIKNKVEENLKNLKDWVYWCVVLNEKLLYSEFVREYLNSVSGKEQLLNMSTGSTIKHLDNTSVQKILIVNQPIKNQKETINNNKQIDDAIKKLQSLKDTETNSKMDFDPDLIFQKIPNFNLKKILSKEETATHEYKTSLRINIATNKPDDRIIHSALKTIVAFLNTKGGNLIIGVSDDKTLVGLTVDRFKNTDEWQLFLKDKIKKQIGAEYLETYIHPEIQNIDGNDIAIIKTDPLPKSETAFLNDAVYVRLGPATAALSHKEMLEWNKKRMLKETES